MDHPIKPPPGLVKQWFSSFYGSSIAPGEAYIDVATQAARWGADQELEACCEWLEKKNGCHFWSDVLRGSRRPKPPNVKEQALALLEPQGTPARVLNEQQLDIIRRALEQLPE